MAMSVIRELNLLYSEASKHSSYQLIPESLKKYLDIKSELVNSRHEKERLDFIVSELDVKDKIVMDIGGNTGYFAFELLNRGAGKIIYYEGNKAHARFVRLGARLLGLEKQISVNDKYFLFEDLNIFKKVDITLLLNVLHHYGAEFGNKYGTLEYSKEQILNALKSLSTITDYLIFQMGFNWKGNKNFGLFEHGTKKEMIDFVKTGVNDCWVVREIGIPQKINGIIKYVSLNDENMARNDELGEFLNRPIFIMESKKKLE